MTTFAIARSAECRSLSTLIPSLCASNFPSVARVKRVVVAPLLGGVASATPTTRARTVTPTATSNIARLITFILSLSLPHRCWSLDWLCSLMAPPLALSPQNNRPPVPLLGSRLRYWLCVRPHLSAHLYILG